MPFASHSDNAIRFWLMAFAASMIAHVGMGGWLTHMGSPSRVKYHEPVRLHARPTPPPAEVKPPETKPEPKRPKPKDQKKSQIPKVAPPDVAPIQGVTKDSLTATGTMSAPVGNTLMVEDNGKRANPNDVKPLQGDMSSPARLIASSVTTPNYTEQAIDAGLEGAWTVDVFIDAAGNVKDAELRKKIGYGMDERVISAARNAKFRPRKNKVGAPEEGWTEIKFTLIIP